MSTINFKNSVGKTNAPAVGSTFSSNDMSDFAKEIKFGSPNSFYAVTKKSKSEALDEKSNKQAIIFIIGKDDGSFKTATDRFFLQSLTKPSVEKAQVIETFVENDPSIFLFGRKTGTFSVNGVLYNAEIMSEAAAQGPGTFGAKYRAQWEKSFKYFWNNHMRATVLLKNSNIAVLLVEDEMYFGYPISLSFSKSSNAQLLTSFNMSWVLIKKDILVNKNELNTFMNFGDTSDITSYTTLTLVSNIMSFIAKISKIIDRKIELCKEEKTPDRVSIVDLEGITFRDKGTEKKCVVVTETSETDNATKKTTITRTYEWSPEFIKFFEGLPNSPEVAAYKKLVAKTVTDEKLLNFVNNNFLNKEYVDNFLKSLSKKAGVAITKDGTWEPTSGGTKLYNDEYRTLKNLFFNQLETLKSELGVN